MPKPPHPCPDVAEVIAANKAAECQHKNTVTSMQWIGGGQGRIGGQIMIPSIYCVDCDKYVGIQQTFLSKSS